VAESCSHSETVSELQRQNDELRRVIRHMRHDIETLGNQQPASTTAANDHLPASTVPRDQIPAVVNSFSTAATDSGLWCWSSSAFTHH